MSLSGFDDPSRTPEPEDLASLLGSSGDHWGRLIELVSQAYEPVSEVWSFGGAKHGWILRLKRRDRVVLYMIPQSGEFLVVVVLGERAVEATRSMHLPESVRTLVDEAHRYAEGRSVRVRICSEEDILAVMQLAAAKMAR